MNLQEQNRLRELSGMKPLTERSKRSATGLKPDEAISAPDDFGSTERPYMDPAADVEFGDSKAAPEVDEWGDEVPSDFPVDSSNFKGAGSAPSRSGGAFDPATSDPDLSKTYDDEFDSEDIMAKGSREYDHDYDDSMTDQLADDEGGEWQDVLDPSNDEDAYENEERIVSRFKSKVSARLMRQALARVGK